MKMSRGLWRWVVLVGLSLAGVLLAPREGATATYYVDQAHLSANDANLGTSESAPWRTLQRAMTVGAGDTVYVKNGTYMHGDPSSRCFNPVPNYNPANSGTAAAPIAFRAYTPPSGSRHRPVVSRVICPDDGENSTVIGANGRNYIIWDGFTLAPFTDARVDFCTGCVFENLIIDKGAKRSPGTGNYTGIWLQSSSNIIVRDNIIRNVTYTNSETSGNSQNASAIIFFSANNVRVYNNEIGNANTGIHDKEGGFNNVYEYNYIHDINGEGIRFFDQVHSRCSASNCVVQFNHVRHNVFFNVRRQGVNHILSNVSGPNIDSDIYVYHNVMYNVMTGVEHVVPLTGLRFYNNILHTNASPFHDYMFFGGVSSDLRSNYSNFRSTGVNQAQFRVGSSIETLAQWQSRGFDLNSTTVDPLFMGPLSGTPPPTAFRLQDISPLINAGRVDGLATGAPINMGAYVRDSDVVGPRGGGDGVAPGIPLNVMLQ